MTQKEIGEAFMSVGILDDLAECIENDRIADLKTVPAAIKVCTERISKLVKYNYEAETDFLEHIINTRLTT